MSQEKGNEDLNTQDLTNIEKLLKELAINVAKLNENILKTTKTYNSSADAVAAHSEQTKKNKLEVQQAYFDNLKEMAKWRKANKEGVSQFQMFTGILRNGVSALGVMRAVTDHLGSLGDKFDEHSRSVSELAELNEKLADRMSAAGKTGDPLTEVATQKARATHGELTQKTKDTAKDDNKTGAFFSFGKKFFEKHAVGMALGAGSAAVILKVLKMAFDASPMFQQMKKLLQFGVMMILRPIGDFFGFLMRPILVMLLRKFIIPWYQYAYPKMIKMGDQIGKILTWLLGFGFANLFSNLTLTYDPDLDPFFGTSGVFTKLGQDIQAIDWAGIKTSITGLFSTLVTDIQNINWADVQTTITDKLTEFASIFTTGNLTESWNKMKTFFSGIGLEASGWLTSQWGKVTSFFKDLRIDTQIGGAIQEAWDGFAGNVTSIFENIVSQILLIPSKIWTGLTSIASSIGDVFGGVISAILDAIESILPFGLSHVFQAWRADIGFAEGGVINEPIIGVGKSGTTYSFGENGSETVIPSGGGGSGVTINIENMSASNDDLEKLRSVILDVLQSSSANRVRV